MANTSNLSAFRKSPIGVIGLGLMGHGIAQVFASAGFTVNVFDAAEDALRNAVPRVLENLKQLGADESGASRIVCFSTLKDAVAECGFIVECVAENLDLKRQIFADLEDAARTDAILASNTSVIPISDIVGNCRTRERMVGTHWWNPPYLVPLVEVIETPWTIPDVVHRTMCLHREIGKTPVHVKKDIPGFIGNRLQHALWREAISLVDRGICDAETIDQVVKTSFGPRLAVLGPMENIDLVGVDLTIAIHEAVLPSLDQSTAPASILFSHKHEGKVGMAVNEGFYSWTDEQKSELRRKISETLSRAYQV